MSVASGDSMSEQQIKQIIDRLDKQDKVLQSIRQEQKDAKIKIETLEQKLEPVHKVFDSVTGFNSVAVLILKGLILIGAGVGVVTGFILWLKK